MDKVSPRLCLFRMPISAGMMMPGKNEQMPKPKINQFAEVVAINWKM